MRQSFAEFGYEQRPNVVYEDNDATIKLANNGEGNYGRTKHIKLRYFCIKELIDAGEVVIKHKSTHEMVADNQTKALIDPAFVRHRNSVHNMSLKPSTPRSSNNEPSLRPHRRVTVVSSNKPTSRQDTSA
jgi:hypothetical protein